jgi:hypothetical protein
MIALRELNLTRTHSFRATANICHLPALRIRFLWRPVSDSLSSQNAPAAFLESWRGIDGSRNGLVVIMIPGEFAVSFFDIR